MSEKIHNMPPGQWEPAGISSNKITLFRAIALASLSVGTIVGLLTGQYLVGILFFCFFIITAGVFATRQVYEDVYRAQFDFIESGRVTTEEALEIPHSHVDRKTSSIVFKVRTIPNPSSTWVALKDYQAEKVENQNILICGMSGTGKTNLLRCVVQLIEPSYRVKVLSFKRKDTGVYSSLGYERVDLRTHRPDPWSNKTAFKRALLVAINLDESKSITANSVDRKSVV